MRNHLSIQLSELLSNPSPRTPIALCLDTSGSMAGQKHLELNRGIQAFYDELRQDDTAASSATLSLITFSTEAFLLQPFQTLDTYNTTPQIPSVGGFTALGSGVNLALDELEFQKDLFKKTGVDYHQPWIVVMTDGRPEMESPMVTRHAAERCRKLEAEGKLVVFPIAIGDSVDGAELGRFTNGEVLRLEGLRFREFFKWLSSSVVRVSQSRTTDKYIRNIQGMNTWRKI